LEELEEFLNTSGVISAAHRNKAHMEHHPSHGAAAQPGRHLSSHGIYPMGEAVREYPVSPVRGDTLIRFMLQFHKKHFLKIVEAIAHVAVLFSQRKPRKTQNTP
jgi:hypothetical protein